MTKLQWFLHDNIGKPAKVEWLDAFVNPNRECKTKTKPTPIMATTFGVIDKMDSESVLIVEEFFDNGEQRDRTTIPFGIIKKVTILVDGTTFQTGRKR